MTARPIYYPFASNVLSFVVLGVVAFLIAELFQIRRLDGTWTCELISRFDDGTDYRLSGVVFDVDVDDKISGVIARIYRRTPTPNMPTPGIPAPDFYVPHHPEKPSTLTGSVRRVAFVIPARVRMIGSFNGLPVVLDLPLRAARRRLSGEYLAGIDEGSVECFETQYVDLLYAQRVLESFEQVRWLYPGVWGSQRQLSKGWVRTNGYTRLDPIRHPFDSILDEMLRRHHHSDFSEERVPGAEEK